MNKLILIVTRCRFSWAEICRYNLGSNIEIIDAQDIKQAKRAFENFKERIHSIIIDVLIDDGINVQIPKSPEAAREFVKFVRDNHFVGPIATVVDGYTTLDESPAYLNILDSLGANGGIYKEELLISGDWTKLKAFLGIAE